VQEAWFRDFSDSIHEHLSKLAPSDTGGRDHLNNLLHVCWLFKKGMEHYVLQGEQAKIDLTEMSDPKPKRNWWGGAA
jgi:hypothetical protein